MEAKNTLWTELNGTVEQVPNKERFFVLMAANARKGKTRDGGVNNDSNVLGVYGSDDPNNNGKRLMTFAGYNELALVLHFL